MVYNCHTPAIHIILLRSKTWVSSSQFEEKYICVLNWTYENIIYPSSYFPGQAKVVFLAYNNLEELLGTAGTHRFQSKMSNDIADVIVNSRILSASINDPLSSGGLVKPAKLTFEHKQVGVGQWRGNFNRLFGIYLLPTAFEMRLIWSISCDSYLLNK